MGENVGQIWLFRTGTTTPLPSYGLIKGRSRTFNIRKRCTFGPYKSRIQNWQDGTTTLSQHSTQVWLWGSWSVQTPRKATEKSYGMPKEKRTTNWAWEASGWKSPPESGERAIKKGEGLSRGKESPSTSEWAQIIDELRSDYPLDLLLESRKMARSVFYYHLKCLKAADRYINEKELIKLFFMSIRDAMAIVVWQRRCITVVLC